MEEVCCWEAEAADDKDEVMVVVVGGGGAATDHTAVRTAACNKGTTGITRELQTACLRCCWPVYVTAGEYTMRLQ